MNAKTEAKQHKALSRFHDQIHYAAEYIAQARPEVELEDALQEARTLVLSYSDLLPSGRHLGRLTEWERYSKGNASDLEGCVTAELKRDLYQQYERAAHTRSIPIEPDSIPDQVVRDPADATVDRLDFRAMTRSMRDEYPFLMMRFEGLSEANMVERTGLSRQTIDRRIADERERATHDAEVIEFLHPSPTKAPRYEPGEVIECAGLVHDMDSKGHVITRTCGEQFVAGNGVEAACSLRDWRLASEARYDAERGYWETGVGGYFDNNDPRIDQPELYAYKGWKPVVR